MTKVMIVDDTAFMAKLARKNLESCGYEVVTAANGQEALDIVEDEKPDVILLDAEMPVMDGWEACEALKSNESTKDIPIIMCTGSSSDENMEDAQELGVAGYIVKPYNLDVMTEKIEKAIKG